MPDYRLPDLARRLDAILQDLGYAPAGKMDLGRVLRVVNRRTRREMARSRLDNLCKGDGSPMTAEEATWLADGLQFDVRRLLYEDGSIPRCPERPENLLDEIDRLWRVKL